MKEQKKITQAVVAGWLSIHPVSYSRFLFGRAGVTIKRLESWSKMTGIGVEEILELRGPAGRVLHMRFRDAYRSRTQQQDTEIN